MPVWYRILLNALSHLGACLFKRLVETHYEKNKGPGSFLSIYGSCNICTIVTIMRAVIEKEIARIMHETSLLIHKYIIVR